MGCKVSISQIDNTLTYYIEEPTLTEEEEKALKSKVQLPQNSVEKVNYYIKRKEYGPLTCLMLDKNVKEIECLDLSKPLYVKINELGRALTNIKITENEIFDIFSKFADKNYRKIGNYAIIENDAFKAIIHIKDNISFNIIKIENQNSESIVELISREYLNVYAAAYLWHIVENSGIIIINGNKQITTNLALSLVNLIYNNFNKIIFVTKSKIKRSNEITILNDIKDLDIIDYYDPDFVLFDYFDKEVANKIVDLNAQNKGAIILTSFPDNVTFLSSIPKPQLLSLSKLPTILVEVVRNRINIHELYSLKTRVKIRKVCKNGNMSKKDFNYSIKLKDEISPNGLNCKVSILDNLTKNNIIDKYEIREKIGEKIEPEI